MNCHALNELKIAVNAALSGQWDKAHLIAQDSDNAIAHWIHAVLHKIEGDAGNSRYWYARAHKSYEDYADPTEELQAIAAQLETARH
ncbi:MAG: hypothetical protein WC696_07465 [Candidatus Methylopumilus sp.]|jgi:hypothetical protein